MLSEMVKICSSEVNRDAYFVKPRREISRIVLGFYHGQDNLRTSFLSGAKMSYLSGRPVLMGLDPLTENISKYILQTTHKDLWQLFLGFLTPEPRTPFAELLAPDFSANLGSNAGEYAECFSCNQCWKSFTPATIGAFQLHSCTASKIGSPISMKSAKFIQQHSVHYTNLGQEQKRLLDLVGSYIFLTGSAGTGKTKSLLVLLERLYSQHGANAVAVVAYSKVAATLVTGKTIHSLFGFDHKLKLDQMNPNEAAIETARQLGAEWSNMHINLKFLILDEVSMISERAMENIHKFLQILKSNHKDAFGGIRIILCGDVMQMPPVMEKEDHYFFHSATFLKGGFKVVYLNKVYRQQGQDQKEFLEILNRMRYNEVTDEDLHTINTTFGKDVTFLGASHALFAQKERVNSLDANGIKKLHKYNRMRWSPLQDNHQLDKFETEANIKNFNHIERLSTTTTIKGEVCDQIPYVVCTTKEEVNSFTGYFSKLYEAVSTLKKFHFKAIDNVENNTHISEWDRNELQNDTKLPNELTVRVGMRVRFTSNQVSAFVANNSIGIVTDINITTKVISVTPYVSKHLVPQTVEVIPITKSMKYNQRMLRRTQFPLEPTYCGISYFVQGLTLSGIPTVINNCCISLNELGLGDAVAYVFFSRFTTKDEVFPLFPVTKNDFRCYLGAKQFDAYFRDNESTICDVTDKFFQYKI